MFFQKKKKKMKEMIAFLNEGDHLYAKVFYPTKKWHLLFFLLADEHDYVNSLSSVLIRRWDRSRDS